MTSKHLRSQITSSTNMYGRFGCNDRSRVSNSLLEMAGCSSQECKVGEVLTCTASAAAAELVGVRNVSG